MADNRADALLATIVQANVDSAARTATTLIDMAKADARDIAKGFLLLYDAITATNPIDRQLLNTQLSVQGVVYLAERVIDEAHNG